jgi:hypothetical protein
MMYVSCIMSIKVSITKPGLSIQAWVKDEALSELLRITQDQHDEPAGIPEGSTGSGVGSVTNDDQTKEWLKARSAAEVLNALPSDKMAEKIFLLGAWHEARGGATPWRASDVLKAFGQAKERTPGNFSRDLSVAIKEGNIHNSTPRSYEITRGGWNRLAQLTQKTGE